MAIADELGWRALVLVCMVASFPEASV